MSEIAPHAAASVDPAMVVARTREDVAIGEEIVRHKLSSRVMHWTVAVTFVVALITGLPIWTPIFGWMAALVGGLHVARWLHPWTGAAFFAGVGWMFVHWFAQMRLTEADRKWLNPTALVKYLSHPEASEGDVGKYNGGQKLFFFTAAIGAIALFASGFVLWWPQFFGPTLREISWVGHDLVFIGAAVIIIGHIYLGTAAFPGSFTAMVRGTVSRAWARLHHPKWYRDVTGERDRGR
jgi:formate dehydrogenase subunit gamma